MIYCDGCYADESIWMIPWLSNINGFIQIKDKKNILHAIPYVDKVDASYFKIIEKDNCLYLIPDNADNIIKYDLRLNKFDHISVANNKEYGRLKYIYSFYDDRLNSLVCISPRNYIDIVSLDEFTMERRYIFDSDKSIGLFTNIEIGKIILGILGDERLIIYDLYSGNTEKFMDIGHTIKVGAVMCSLKDSIYIYERGSISKIGIKSRYVEKKVYTQNPEVNFRTLANRYIIVDFIKNPNVEVYNENLELLCEKEIGGFGYPWKVFFGVFFVDYQNDIVCFDNSTKTIKRYKDFLLDDFEEYEIDEEIIHSENILKYIKKGDAVRECDFCTLLSFLVFLKEK